MMIDKNKVSETHRLSISENGKIISRLYIRDKQDDKPVYLFRVKTNVSHRRKGLASELIKSAIEKYKKRGLILRACHQKAGPSADVLIKIYKKFGFKRKGQTKTMYIDPPKILKVGDRTELRCPICNRFMRVANLPYEWTSHSAYGDAQHETSYTDNGRECKKCGLQYLHQDYIIYKSFRIEVFETLSELKQWFKDVDEGKGKDIRRKGRR